MDVSKKSWPPKEELLVIFFSLSGLSGTIFYLCSHLKGSEQLLLQSHETKLRQDCVPVGARDVGVDLPSTSGLKIPAEGRCTSYAQLVLAHDCPHLTAGPLILLSVTQGLLSPKFHWWESQMNHPQWWPEIQEPSVLLPGLLQVFSFTLGKSQLFWVSVSCLESRGFSSFPQSSMVL